MIHTLLHSNELCCIWWFYVRNWFFFLSLSLLTLKHDFFQRSCSDLVALNILNCYFVLWLSVRMKHIFLMEVLCIAVNPKYKIYLINYIKTIILNITKQTTKIKNPLKNPLLKKRWICSSTVVLARVMNPTRLV